jgi:hypothetical protein
MIDSELQLMTDWRYCNVTPGDKKPYPNEWNKKPLTLDQVESTNIGLQLGEHSNGTCAIDFDGEEAIDYWNNTFPDYEIDKFQTVMWSSGKPYRLQAAFTVPEYCWDVLKRKVVNKLEFRWGGQSVLPPSKLIDGRQYYWVGRPSRVPLRPLMPDVLNHWLQLILDDYTKYDNVQPTKFELSDFDEEYVNQLLERISKNVGNLRGDYDVWRTIAWATCSAVGISTARMLMQYYWPEKTNKELQTLLSYKVGVGPKIGTLIKLSGIKRDDKIILEREYRKRKYNENLKEIELIRQVLKEKTIVK